MLFKRFVYISCSLAKKKFSTKVLHLLIKLIVCIAFPALWQEVSAKVGSTTEAVLFQNWSQGTNIIIMCRPVFAGFIPQIRTGYEITKALLVVVVFFFTLKVISLIRFYSTVVCASLKRLGTNLLTYATRILNKISTGVSLDSLSLQLAWFIMSPKWM